MTFEEAIKALKDGEKIRRRDWLQGTHWFIKNGEMVKSSNGSAVYKVGYVLTTDLLADDWEIYQEPILDEEERKYLSAVIRPFKNKVEFIKKHRYGNTDFIYIGLNSHEVGIGFPGFKKDTMYKGMQAYKEYTLKELGL